MDGPTPSVLGPQARTCAVDAALVAHRRFLYLCFCLFLLSFTWAACTDLDIVSEAVGEVIPQTKVKKIQHLEGGIVSEILVREGDVVKQDQPLIVLDAAAADATTEELEVRLVSLQIEALRLDAESKGLAQPVFPQALEQKRPGLVDQARNLFQARRSRLHNDLATLGERVRQREQDIQEASARLDNLRRNLPHVVRQVERSQELLRPVRPAVATNCRRICRQGRGEGWSRASITCRSSAGVSPSHPLRLSRAIARSVSSARASGVLSASLQRA